MKYLILFLVLVITLTAYSGPESSTPVAANMDCNHEETIISKEWITYADPCFEKMKHQVQTELQAAIAYLSMGAYFSQDKVNRPGFAKFFFESASEERQHAIKLIEYLLMRGSLENDIKSLIEHNKIVEKVPIVGSGVEALEKALDLEVAVTKDIRDIIITCESPPVKDQSGSDKQQPFNDYHLVDYLTGEFLTEQYQGQRDIAGKLVTLKKMEKHHNALGEFLFDKKLLNGEV